MSITCLTHLFTPAGLLADGDGDGLPDGFFARFVVGRTPGAIDVAARLGLESAAFTPGFTACSAPGVPVYFGPDNPDCPPVDVPSDSGIVALTESGVVVSGATPAAGWAAARWLAECFPFVEPGGPLLADLAAGRLVHAAIVRDGRVTDLVYGPQAGTGSTGTAEAGAPVDKPTREGAPAKPAFLAEAPGDLPPLGSGQLFTVAGLMSSSDSARHDRSGWQVQIAPSTTAGEVAALCELAARTGVEATGLKFPFAVSESPLLPCVRLAPSAPPVPLWEEEHLAFTRRCLTAFGTPSERAAALHQAAGAGLVDGLHATLFTRRAALPETPLARGAVVYDLTLEAEWEVDRFRRLAREQVLPLLKGSKPVSVDLRLSEPQAVRQMLAAEIQRDLMVAGLPEVSVQVRSAYKQGFHWLEEEMLPELARLRGLARIVVTCAPFLPEEPQRPLEMVIRWLQELYPADELLAKAMPGVAVSFELASTTQADIYQLNALRADGSVACAARFTPVYTSRPYLPEFPARGQVHPATGYLRVKQGGAPLIETAIETDVEALWTEYQTKLLPLLRRYLLETHGPAPDPASQPFFGALVIEATLSEDDRRLGVREEQISPLDALHEDLYFYTLDYLNELGSSLTGTGYSAPGAVEPWIFYGEGKPKLRVRLYARSEAPVTPTPTALPEHAAGLPEPVSTLPEDWIIGPEQLPACLAHLAKLPGVRVWRTGLSFGGRPTWALSVLAPTAGRIAPPQKMTAWRPTLLVNARHHANEVSSTNSILKLAEIAVREGYHRQVNLVLSPMANMDGAALHYAMQMLHPTWKLHAARFNAAGIDFAADSWAAEPHFGEARTVPTLWRAFLPDVVLDDHGYPSHEWVQPFAGHNSPPYFKTSWWMPNAMIYSIHRCPDRSQFQANDAADTALRDALAERLTADPAIAGYTRVLLDRYITYGQRYVPEKFPRESHRGFPVVSQAVKAGPESRSYVGRFPHITLAELVTEVPDETAQGEYLAQCVRAHLEGDLAVLGCVAGWKAPVVRQRSVQDGRVLWTVARDKV